MDQENINIRLQKLICCIGNLGGEIQSMIAVGNTCYKDKLHTLKILIGFLEALECYNTEDEVLSYATFNFLGDPGVGTGSIQLLVNGIPISSVYNVQTGTLTQNTEWLAEAINNYQTLYTATVENDIITITGTCETATLSFEIVDRTGWGYEYEDFTIGNCVNNCITEEQMEKMFEQISKYCDICFPNGEYKWTNSLITE